MTSIRSVLFAKLPVPGQVKTRLISPGGLDAAGAARIASACLRCTTRRLADLGPLVIAVTPDGAASRLADQLTEDAVAYLDQGAGDLGARIDRVWRSLPPEDPVAFFGADTPDVPLPMLLGIAGSLHDADVAVGPTEDGGYWCLAARRYCPEVLERIDWGSERVYDQTRNRAREAGLRLAVMPTWSDLDRPDDLDSLRQRLADRFGRSGTADDDRLDELASELDALLTR